MASLTLTQSLAKIQNPIWQGIGKLLSTRDELASRIPFAPLSGMRGTYVRETALPSVAFVDDAGSNLAAPSVATFENVPFECKRIVGDSDYDALGNLISNGRDKAEQTDARIRATWDKVRRTICQGGANSGYTLAITAAPFTAITALVPSAYVDARHGIGAIKYTHAGTLWSFRSPGDLQFGPTVAAATNGTYRLRSSSPSRYIDVTLNVAAATANSETGVQFTNSNEFDGIQKLVDPAFVRDPSGGTGDALSFRVLNELLRMERTRENRVIMMNGAMLLRFMDLVGNTPGMAPSNTTMPTYAGMGQWSWRGIPVLECDEIPNETIGGNTQCSSIYVASLSAENGLFLGYPDATASASYDGDPRRAPVMGWFLQDVGAVEDAPNDRVRVHWTGALGLRAAKSMARARGIQLA